MAAKKSCNAVCFKDERKKEDPLSTEIQRQCEGTKNDHEVQKTSTRNPEKENLIICHSVEEGTKYDHEGQKTSKRNLEKENPIVRHSVEEGEEHKRTKLFSPFLCT
ncbi:hypothetical protein JEQ12_020249 [Ovis aries]|uniref:Uncharacterized protein n=1 Tax=Ovis aries TaxID=9940 RepID=A0A835ZIT4_SHEEP|nr:hypothetical protein JEQ12_020249 [Ovis aries]